jgi:hypothetical protein
MTNQNPASSKSSGLDRDILAKVNAHADRSIDRIFADIDELLNDGLEDDTTSLSVHNSAQRTQYSTESPYSQQYPQQSQVHTYPPQSDFTSQRYTSESVDIVDPIESPSQQLPKQKKRIPLWMKALIGISITSAAVGGGLTWLINERKIEIPKNIDTSWLPFQPQSQVSPDDAKFAEYMRNSISKIESANTPSTSATNIPSPASSIAAPITQTVPINPTGIIATTPNQTATNAVKTPIALLKTLQANNHPSAIFQIDRQNQTVHIGQKIGTSNWSLLTVAKGEVIVKRKGGEIRSVYVGQKF